MCNEAYMVKFTLEGLHNKSTIQINLRIKNRRWYASFCKNPQGVRYVLINGIFS